MKNILLVAFAGSLSLSSASTYAEDSKLENERQISQHLLVCRALDSAVERLDCYDKVARTLESHSGSLGSIAEVREEAASRPQPAATADNFGREHRPPQASEQDGKLYVEVAEAWQNPRGLWRFRLNSGAEWHQTQSERFNYSEDNNYYIERGALNSFRLGWDGSNRNIRVRRVD